MKTDSRHSMCWLGLGLVLGACVLAPMAGTAAPADKPNIIFILSDDYGLDGVSCYGSDRFKTPNIDTLASGGLRFENAYCTPLCGPTRCLFVTGRYGFRTGGLSNRTARRPSPAEETSVAKLLKQAGYVTCQAGKWRQMDASPGDWGFDEYITDPTAGGYYWQTTYTKNGQLIEPGKEIYYPDVCHEFAVDFLKRNKSKPFFLYYASHLVHGPILKTPDTKEGADKDQLYADNVVYLDKQVGDLVAQVDRLGLRDKTLIIFAADNGTAGRSGTIGGRQVNGHKGTMLEGGAHVPFIANWKGVTPAGKVIKDLIDFSDLYATFGELAGAKPPPGVTLDGRSFAPQLRGQTGRPREWIFVQLGTNWYVRELGWKLNNKGELFDMTAAPFEEKLVSDAASADAAQGRKRLQAVLDQLNPAAGKTEPPVAPGAKAAKKKRAQKNK
jgi:arylsulfatase A